MPLLAVTVTGHSVVGWLLLVALVALAVLVYAGSCWLFPFRRCRRCNDGRIHREDRKVFRLCRRCKGSGRRLRFGRWLYNHLARVHREVD